MNAARMLVLDESRPLVKKLAENYNITLAQPALVNFEFALAFVKKGVTPAPAAIKLSEALQQVGYSGPLITQLEQISMYVVAFGESVEAIEKPAASFSYNVDLGLVTLAGDISRPLPVNTTMLANL